MPKLIISAIAVAAMALIATLIAVIEQRPPPPAAPTPGPDAVFTLVDDATDGSERQTCGSHRLPPPPPDRSDGEMSVSATVDRAIYECLFVHTRPGILSPQRMPQDRVAASIANLTKAPMAKTCREQAALSPPQAVVSAPAAQQISQRVSLCYASLPAADWHETNAETRRDITNATADLLTAYAYSYHRLDQEQALQCRTVFIDATNGEHIETAENGREALQAAEHGRRHYCGCVLASINISSDNPVRNRSC